MASAVGAFEPIASSGFLVPSKTIKLVFEEILEDYQAINSFPFSNGDFFTLSKHLSNLKL